MSKAEAPSRFASWPFPSVIGLLIFFVLGVGTAVAKAPTVDESVHVLRGVTLWQTRVMELQFEHGPFSHWLIGMFLPTEPTLDKVAGLPSWATFDRLALADELLWQYEPPPNIDRIFFLARMPVVLLGLLTGAVLARWAGTLWGRWGQGIALSLFAFSPNLLAHFSLATTDGALTAVFLAAMFTWWWYWKRPSPQRWLLAAIMLGVALATKLTALLLFPLTLILGLFWRPIKRPWWFPVAAWLGMLLVARFIVWLLYGFELKPVADWPIPVPAATFFTNLLQLVMHMESGQPAYLLGNHSTTGWWYYFIVAFFIKTPVPVLILLLLALVLLTVNRRWWQTMVLWLPAAALFAFASYSRFNIGYRHILPLLPFVFLLGASTGPFWRERRRVQPILVLLMFWMALRGWQQYPHYIPYFNELVGGSAAGYRYLGDSNIDWGQDLKLLRDYVNSTDEQMFVSYLGTADPAYHGLQLTPLFKPRTGEPVDFARANPAPGKYAISVGHWQGLGLTEVDTFDWFRRQEPSGNLGYSILLFDVAQSEPGDWVANCLDPGPLLSPEQTTQLVGKSSLRQVYFDCRSSWIFPDDGSPGWYILPQRDSWPMAAQFPGRLQPVYMHNASLFEPSYAVWYWDGQADLTAWTAVSGDPVPFDETASLMGYTVGDVEWWTIWQVEAAPTTPLTVAAHLYGDVPTPVVADGLGFSSEQWQPGDWLVQIHRFGAGGNGRYLETGLYNYLTGERLADFVQLRP